MNPNSMRDRFAMVASQLLNEDERVAVVLAEISMDRFRATGAPARHPARLINVGIREQLLVNVAAGMALEGMRPIAHTFASFLVERAFEQVKLGFSHQGVGGVLVSAGASYDEPAYGRTHGAPEDVALVGALPGWRIDVPGHADEVEDLLREAVRSEAPVYIRLSERTNERPYAAVGGGLVTLRSGGAAAPTIIAVGPMADPVLEATAGIGATVLYAATVRPFDSTGLRGAVRGSEVVLIEPYLQGTSAAEVAAALGDRPIRLLSLGVPRAEDRRYGRAGRHDAANGLDAAGLRARISAWLAGGTAETIQPAAVY